MSVAFVPERLRGKAEVNQETLQRLLEENDQLIRCIVEYQSKGRATDCVHAETSCAGRAPCSSGVRRARSAVCGSVRALGCGSAALRLLHGRRGSRRREEPGRCRLLPRAALRSPASFRY
ncbi:SS18-like protein 2 isoform X1 [Caloenas nicobarica]|uniref:SS18-like protein 2 isoform X1 n=1 Tax=Caloenas nicobarica TaxID=187106 RepID=UPI0032B84D26